MTGLVCPLYSWRSLRFKQRQCDRILNFLAIKWSWKSLRLAAQYRTKLARPFPDQFQRGRWQELLVAAEASGPHIWPTDWSPDTRFILFARGYPLTQYEKSGVCLPPLPASWSAINSSGAQPEFERWDQLMACGVLVRMKHKNRHRKLRSIILT
jgi:hypothetical protein